MGEHMTQSMAATHNDQSEGDNTDVHEISLQTRLKELCVEGNESLAIQLARGVLNNTEDVHVDISSDTILIETKHFRGVHNYEMSPDQTAIIDHKGQYNCTLDEIDLSFTTKTLNPTAFQYIQSAMGTAQVKYVHSNGTMVSSSPDNSGMSSEPDDPLCLSDKIIQSIRKFIRYS